jgi:hypothetical protein
MICNLTDLNAALDWFERENAKPSPGVAVPTAKWETVQYRGWLIERYGRNPFRIFLRTDAPPELWPYRMVAPWVVEELGKLATVET